MRYNDLVPRTRLRAVVALALAIWIVVSGAEWAASDAHGVSHGPHALDASPYGGVAVVSDHPHVGHESTLAEPDAIAEAVLPRATVALVALGLVATVAASALFWRQASPSGIRGPPRRLCASESGRVLLTRLCVARR